MPPENQYVSPTPTPTPTPPPQVSPPLPPSPQTPNGAPSPDYSFLGEQPKKSFKLPLAGNSFLGRLVLILVVGLLLVILIVIIRGIISPAQFSKADYLLLAERQHEMLHILTVDINNNNFSQLNTASQNFVSTATATLSSAESKTLQFMTSNKDKVSATQIAKVYSTSVDSELASAQSSNNLNAALKSEMQLQLNDYEQNLKTAYNSTRLTSGRNLLVSEYSEAKMLIKALGTSS